MTSTTSITSSTFGGRGWSRRRFTARKLPKIRLRLFEEDGPPDYSGDNTYGMSIEFDDINDIEHVEEILEIAANLVVTGEAVRVMVTSFPWHELDVQETHDLP
jgi:hypothetical protein